HGQRQRIALDLRAYRAALSLHGLELVDLGIDAGQVLGVTGAEEAAAGQRSDPLQAGLIDVIATHRQLETEYGHAAIAAEGNRVDAHATVARDSGSLLRIQHAGGV